MKKIWLKISKKVGNAYYAPIVSVHKEIENALNERCEMLEKCNHDMNVACKNDVAEIKQLCADLDARKEKAIADNVALRKEYAELEESFKVKERDVELLNTDLTEQRELAVKLQKELQGYKGQCAKLSNRIVGYKGKIAALEQELEQYKIAKVVEDATTEENY